ncbi:NAD(P)-binding protein [soil metagenome]
MAGLACATALRAAGYPVTVLDKGRGPGGRMSARRAETPVGLVTFDHGAQYFTARDPGFRAQVDAWAGAGVCAPWPAAGDEAWVGTPAMNAPIRALAEPLGVMWSRRVDALVPREAGWALVAEGATPLEVEVVILATPAEQAAVLLAPHDATSARLARETPAQPCWTVMASFAKPLPVAADLFRGQGVIGWAARNSAKPGRGATEAWVIQATPEWSAAHLEDPAEAVADRLAAAFADLAGVEWPPTLSLAAHRWRYARSGAAGVEALWSPETGLGVCGDWLIGPRVECAWLSGLALAAKVGAAPPRPCPG